MIKTTVGIEGMSCGMCESHINSAIRRELDVKSVKSDRRRRQCVITSETPLDESRVRSIIEKTGYTFVSFSEEEGAKKGLFGF